MSTVVNPEIQKIQQAIEETQVADERAKVGEQEIRLETGEVFKGTPTEILEKLKQAKVEASRTIQERNRELEALRAQVAAQNQPKPEVQTGADNTQYFEKWAKAPEDATIEAIAKQVGMTKDQYIVAMKATMQNSFVNSASSEFLNRCPDFPESPENGAMLAQSMRSRYGNEPTSMTADNLELTYHQLVREGKMAPRQVPITGTMQPMTPLPNLRGNSAPANPETDMIQRFSEMNEEQQASTLAMLRRREMGGG